MVFPSIRMVPFLNFFTVVGFTIPDMVFAMMKGFS